MTESSQAALQEWMLTLVWWGGAVLAAIGGLKLAVYLVGAARPGLYDKIGSASVRRFFQGRGNGLVFGLGGMVTLAMGLFFMLAARGLMRLMEQFRL